jgi:hypothetical protein
MSILKFNGKERKKCYGPVSTGTVTTAFGFSDDWFLDKRLDG